MNFNSEIIVRIELLISSIGVIIGLFLGIFLLFKKEDYLKANVFLSLYLLVFSLRMTKSLFYNFLDVNITVHHIFLGSLLIIGPSLWFYFLHLQKHSINKVYYLVHYSPFFIFIIFSWLIPYYGRSSFFYLGLFLHGLVYSFIVFFSLITKKPKLSKEKNREIKTKKWLLLLTLITVIIFSNSILIFFEVVPFFPTSSFLFSVSIITLSIYALNNLWIFKSTKIKYSKSSLSINEVTLFYGKLKKIVEEEKVYLDTELTLVKLSEQVGISSKQLSQIINQTQKVNYSQYIANYRIEEAKRLLKNPDYKLYKISAIAYECGFSSISSFNSVFKKITNTTAIKFRESIF